MDELLIPQIPRSVEAEQAVIGSMLIDARCVPAVMERLTEEDFTVGLNQDIFRIVSDRYDHG